MKKLVLLIALTTILWGCEKGVETPQIDLKVVITGGEKFDLITAEQIEIPFKVEGNDLSELLVEVAIASTESWITSVEGKVKDGLYAGNISVTAPAIASTAILTLSIKDRKGKIWSATAALTASLPQIDLKVVITGGEKFYLITAEQIKIPFKVEGNDLSELLVEVAIASTESWITSVEGEVKDGLYAGNISVTAPTIASTAILTLSIKDRKGKLWSATAALTASLPPITAINLSANGTANCYIISTEGEYMFDASKRGNGSGNGSSIVTSEQMKADWLWVTTTMENKLADIHFDKVSEHIFFTTTTPTQGNAVVVLCDDSGAIIWSWHLWFTDQPANKTYKNQRVMMDRSLGATATEPGSSDAYGLYYQWGRKEPFCGGTTTETSATAFAEATRNSIINPAFTATHTWKQETGAAVSTIDYATSHPLSFISNKNATTSYYDWLTRGDNNLWNTAKTIYDPCPIGYKVPDRDSWDDFADSQDRYIDGVTEWDGVKYGVSYTDGSTSDWYPTQGYRNKDQGNLVGLLTTRTGHYWSNYRSGNAISFFYISKKLSTGKLLQPQSTSKSDAAFGFNVRCCKE